MDSVSCQSNACGTYCLLGFNVILTGSFFPKPYRCREAGGFVFCILLCNTDSTALYNVCGCVDDCK